MKRFLQIALFALAVILAVSFSVFCFNGQSTFKNSRLGMNGEPLIALNKAAVSSEIKNPKRRPYVYYKFTLNQQVALSSLVHRNHGGAVEVTVELLPDVKLHEKDSYAFGFLYEKDFKNSKKLNSSIESRNLVTGIFPSDFSVKKTVLSFCIADGDELPSGFFIYSRAKCSVSSIHFTVPKLGFSRDGDSALFAFGPSGGETDYTFSAVNLTEGEKFFPSENSSDAIMPKITLEFFELSDAGTIESQKKVFVRYADEKLTVRRSVNQSKTELQTSAFKEPFSFFEITSGSEMVKSVMLTTNSKNLLPEDGDVLSPLPTDLGLIFEWNKKNWRRPEYELFQWETFPEVLLFDFADYRTQDLFFTRLAYFVEKKGYKGTFVDDEFIKTAHGYNAHDYKAEDLARFFALAEKQHVKLCDEEILLRKILLKNKIILSDADDFYVPGKGAVISISRESKDYQRYTLLAHESWHGIYFIDEDFRDVVYMAYSMFDPYTMEFLKTYWETQPTLNYDRTDEYLMQNEFMAYMLQNSVTSISKYWIDHAKWNSVQREEKELADYVIENEAMSFKDACEFLSSYVFDRWGLCGGRAYLVSR